MVVRGIGVLNVEPMASGCALITLLSTATPSSRNVVVRVRHTIATNAPHLAQLVAAQVSNQLQARSPPPPAPLVNTAQTPPTFEINRLVAEQVQQQLKVHYAATPPTFGAPHYPTPPNFGPPTDVLDW
jgi:hypothetical protein